ncbi:MAG: sugar phosphate isomerase [Planctomycetota bacterium]|jgi:N-acetylmuramic acid 6-phosphate etherase
MGTAAEKAREFVEREKAFRLGELLTESFHPKTRRLSQTIQADLAAGVRLLQSVDEDITAACPAILGQAGYGRLVASLLEAMRAGRRVYFTGCGATGRLSILLEAAWRRCWRALKQRHPEIGRDIADLEDLCVSVMAGGDFALIKSVEGFEDFPDFGRHQLREAGVGGGDVVVAITEGGETPFVIGTAWEGLAVGATVFFVYNNPTGLLREHVERSREVIEEPRIGKLDLTTGPMAIAGSTRMQATTTELLVVGAALETALMRWLGEGLPSSVAKTMGQIRTAQDYHRLFSKLLGELSGDEAVDAMARAVAFEERIYGGHGLVTYAADDVLLDVLTDTTERSPTFMVPPFRQDGDTRSPVPWAFVKNPQQPTREAWRDILQREPRGLDWGPVTYQQLNAPEALRSNPPKLDNDEIHRFRIGNERDGSRTEASESALVTIEAGEAASVRRAAVDAMGADYRRAAAVTIGPATGSGDAGEHFHFQCGLPVSALRLWEHLAVKLVLNTISTATMVRMGRVIGNAMVWVSPSNKKLIDRGTRLIAQQTGCSYARACEALHEAMEEVTRCSERGQAPPSPVALAIERIGGMSKEETI